MKDNDKIYHKAFIVLGMHRSGTSALTRTLNLCGIDLGSNLMPPGPEDNVKGFWEHMDIYQMNEKLLQDLGSSWDDVRALPDRWWNSDKAEAYKLEIISILEREFTGSPFWGVKDPRICRFLPLWRPILEQTGNKPFFIIIVRNPLEVVASLSKRDGFSKGKSCLLWLKHLIESEKGTRNTSRMFVTYEELLSDWKGLFTRVEKTFGFKWPKNPMKASSEIKSFLQDSMRHNRVTHTALTKDKTLSKWIRDMYLAINDLVDGDDTRLIKTVNTVEAKLKEAVSLYEPALTEIWEKYKSSNTMLQERSQQLDDVNNQIEGFSQDRGYHLSSIDHLQSGIKEKDERIQQLDSELIGLHSELSTVQQTAVRREVEVAHLQAGIKERDARIQRLDSDAADLRKNHSSLQSTVLEREAKISYLEAGIRERGERIQHLDSELVRIYGELSNAEKNVAGFEAQVTHLQTGIREKDDDIQKIDTELAGLRDKFAASQQAVAEHESKVDHLQAEIKERDEHIQRLESDFAGMQEQYIALQGVITEREPEFAHLQSSIKEKDDHVQQIDTELAVLREEFGASQQSVKEHESKVDQLQAEIKERDEHIQRLESDSADLQEQYTALQGAIAERDAEVAHLQGSIKEKDDHIQQIDTELAGLREEFAASKKAIKDHETKVANLETAIKEKDERIHQLDVDVGRFRDEADSLRTHVENYRLERESIFDSTSWKLTAPLRWVSVIARYLNRNLGAARYLFGRQYRLIKKSGLFDSSYYLEQNPDVAESGMNPLAHYLKFGARERRNPNSLFETSYYLYQNPDVAKSATNPLLHYIKYGKRDRKETNTFYENFDERFDSFSNIVNSPPSSKLEQNGYDEEYIYRAYRRPEERASYEPEENPNPPNTTIKLLAFYFPQYHPFEENDKFWGKGFTEWTSTTKASPLFEGQYQPRLPGELGFYDTRIKEVMIRQIELAKQYGIYGFCFHHYFFDGKPVMRVPFNQIMTNKDLDIPFCLHWANEPWTIRWDGFEEKGGVLLDQHHTAEDDFLFFKDIEPALKDERYIRIKNRPLLIIYRPGLFPDIKSTIERWREHGHKSGIGELFFAVLQTGFDGNVDPRDIGFDAAIEYPPHNVRAVSIKDKVNLFDPKFQGNIFSYSEMVKGALERSAPGYKLFRGVMPDWDCTPRRRNPDIFIGSSPEKYQRWLEGACSYTQKHLPVKERFIFINAWNEWAEGAYLEPDSRFGYSYLNATAKALSKNSYKLAVIIHIYYTDLTDEFVDYLKNIPLDFDLYVSTTHSEEVSVRSELETNFPDKYISVKGVSNTGFDVAPFLLDFKGVHDKYDLICKVHSKKSLHWDDHHIWRRYLMENLLGSKYIVEKIIDSFTINPNLGILFPENFPSLKDWIGWGENFKKAQPLLKKMGIKISEEDRLEYTASTMFWFRPDALSPLFKLKLKKKDFSENPQTKRDGTLAHTIERIVLLSAIKQGYTWEKVLFTKPGQKSQDTPIESSKNDFSKIAVVTHLFYTDLLNEFIIYYKNIPCKFDLFLSTKPEKVEYVSEKLKTHFPNHKIDVRGVVNKGRDMAPFVVEFSRMYKQYDIICFTHTKKSDYNAKYNYLDWRRYLLDNILGSQYDVANILSDFQKNPELGLLFPEYFPLISDKVEWGSNFEMSSNLLSRMNISIAQNDKLEFPAGSMFWFRPQALDPLFNIGLTLDDFEELSEQKTDGTLAHAIERLPVFITEHQGFKWKKVMFKRYSQGEPND